MKVAAAENLIAEVAQALACVTCSFQTECMALVHLLTRQRPDIPVLFLDTGYHFAETYEYRDRMTAQLGLNLTNLQPRMTVAQQEGQFGILYRSAPDRCCGMRKVEPLFAGLEPYNVWFTALRRDQSPTRANLREVDEFQLPSGKTLMKVSPLADWTARDVWSYLKENAIPVLPLYDSGYTSIGCEPCTSLPLDPRIHARDDGQDRSSNAASISRASDMVILLGFIISLAIGITGVGGGTITVPVLMLFLHISPDKTVGTALAFAAIVKLLVAPVYIARKQVDYKVLGLMVAGGLPGLIVGLYCLHRLHNANQGALLTILIGALIVFTAIVNLFRVNKQMQRDGVRDRSRWLPWVMLPIGAEVGFSSAGAGAIGTLALLNLTRLTTVQVVGTDVLFGLVLSVLGGGFQVLSGSYDPAVLTQLAIGGVAGALIGPNIAAWLPSKPLRVALCLWLASLGTVLCWRAM